MSARRLSLCALEGLPLIAPGDDLAGLLAGALRAMQIAPRDGDILVVAQKVVSKAEGRIVDLDSIEPSP
ncbi:MAG TPA: coenzyme F420-0:L-glutamate ligase, partial [Vicinamibacterales bacterium]|nr:coenzyme F420-0:L-glutamate ligase [Vicinamibacterales bacterium]